MSDLTHPTLRAPLRGGELRSNTELMNCHQCGGIVTAEDRFCEECGASLTTDAPTSELAGCQKCGAAASEIGADRYCNKCGHRQVEISHDPIELQPAPNLAGVSDRGRRHHQNEDAIALRIVDPHTSVLVVCDGVSSSQHPELASQAAVTACIQAIEIALNAGIEPDLAIAQGVAAALTAVANVPFDPEAPDDPSSTTIVTAIVRHNLVTIGWLGDSRAYWIAPAKSLQLTQDDSWLRDAIESGMNPTEAEKSPYAHAIVRWLGADVPAAEAIPTIATFTIPTAGYLLLCTDGLWNYAPDPAYLHHLIQQTANNDPLAIARELVRYANQQGGQDNITVGILGVES
jgi:PPM family protein phosphatase